jgi:assimilatory nitrate reductase catalytic subunit
MNASHDPGACGAIRTTCPYCGVGCGVDATPSQEPGGAALNPVTGTLQHPANLGRLCVKGSALHEAIGQGNRLLYPEVAGERVSWDAALDAVAQGFAQAVAEHGPESVAFYLSGQLLTEDYYVANKLMKGFLGSSNVDTNSRLCMASAVAGYKRAFGADAVPCSYEDLELCDLLVITGSNAAWTHPVLFQRINAAREARPELKVVVIDPRRTATCDIADLFLPLRPGSDAFLFNGLLHWLWQHDSFDWNYLDAHCEGGELLLPTLLPYTLDAVSAATDVPAEDLERFYRLFAATERSVTFYSQGINQSATGTDKCNAIINCHLVTGRIGKAGMGPFSITGQPNAMGGREVGGLANQLAAHMDFNEENVDRVSRFWDAARMAHKPGLKAVELFQAVRDGRIKALWIMGTNPAVSLPESDAVNEALRDCPFVVVSDCVRRTDTTRYADVLLPATGWSEKDGTVTNSERCISRQRALFVPSGAAKHDWQIITHVARRLGFAEQFAYECPRDVFVEHAALSSFENDGKRAFDIGALSELSAGDYDAFMPMQWPVTAAAPNGTARLFGDGRYYTPSGRARLVPVTAELPSVRTDDAYPLLLNTGRLRDQWHTMTRTGDVPRLAQHSPNPFISLPVELARELDVDNGDLVRVSSRYGELLLPAMADPGLRSGEVFIPIHWNARFASNAKPSSLIGARVDPVSGQPESKLEAVALEAVPAAEWFTLVLRQEARSDGSFNDIFAYWDKRPVQGGWCYRFAATTPVAAERLRALLHALPAVSWLRCAEEGNELRAAAFAGKTLIAALFRAPTPTQLPDTARLQRLLQQTRPAAAWRQVQAGDDDSGKGSIICSCREVGQDQIVAAIKAGADTTQALGRKLGCGTGCGSCIPELKQLLAQHRPGTPAVAACAVRVQQTSHSTTHDCITTEAP